MSACYCDWPTVTEPPCIHQSALELHRAWHDLGRAIIDAIGVERLLERLSR